MPFLSNPNSDNTKIVDLISYDTPLTANVLRVCNSAYYSRGTATDNLLQAVTRLGSSEVYKIVVAVTSAATLSSSQKGYGVEVGVDAWIVADDDFAASLQRQRRVVGDGAHDGWMRDDREHIAVTTARRAKLVRDEVGLDEYAVAGFDQVAEWIPLPRAEATGVAAEQAQGLAHGPVDGVGLGGSRLARELWECFVGIKWSERRVLAVRLADGDS
jgi:hypothetical protein